MENEVKERTAAAEEGVAKTETTTRDAEDTAELVDILEGYLSALRTIDKKLLDCGRNDERFPSAQRLVDRWINRLKGEYRVTYAGEAARMREALEWIASNSYRAVSSIPAALEMSERARAALSAPARNCDVYPAKEWKRRFKQFCRTRPDRCRECPVFGMWDFSNGEEASCLAIWATMPHAGAGWPTQGARNEGGLEAGASSTGQEGGAE